MGALLEFREATASAEPTSSYVRRLADLAANKHADPRDAARTFAGEIDDARLRDVVEYLAPHVIRLMHFEARTDARKLAQAAPSPTGTPRTKWDNAAVYRAFCARRECVGGTWKVLGECALSDVEWLGSARRSQSDALATEAARFDRLAKVMRSFGAVRVADLPPDAVTEVAR